MGIIDYFRKAHERRARSEIGMEIARKSFGTWFVNPPTEKNTKSKPVQVNVYIDNRDKTTMEEEDGN